MPNTPMLVGEGMVAMARGTHATADDLAQTRRLFEAAAEVIDVREDQMDAVTAVSGSGPAYIFLLAEELARAGVAAGLPEALATKLARETVAGSGELLHRSEVPAATLRQNVTSPGGTTAAAIAVLMADDGLAPLMERAILAADERMSASHHLVSVRAHLLERAGERDAARAGYHEAARRTTSEPERRHLLTRAARLG